jgi:hypothetical protein
MYAKLARRFYKRPDTSRKGCFAIETAASIDPLVSNKLAMHWKAIQRERTSYQPGWPVPTKEELLMDLVLASSRWWILQDLSKPTRPTGEEALIEQRS